MLLLSSNFSFWCFSHIPEIEESLCIRFWIRGRPQEKQRHRGWDGLQLSQS